MAITPLLILIRMLGPRLRAMLPNTMYTSNAISLVVSHGATNGYCWLITAMLIPAISSRVSLVIDRYLTGFLCSQLDFCSIQ